MNKSLHYLNVNTALLSTVKCNPLTEETKGTLILNIEKLYTIFGQELSLDISQWSKVAENMYNFQEAHVKQGSLDDHAQWFAQHFGFFMNQHNKVENYEAWKSLELELCEEFYSEPTAYDTAYYANQYAHAKSKHEMRLSWLFSSRLLLQVPDWMNQINLVTSLAFQHMVDLVSLHAVMVLPPHQLPFQQALAEQAPLLATYSAQRGATPSTITLTHPHLQNLPTASLCGQNLSMALCSPQMVTRCAQTTTFKVSTPPSLVITRKETTPTSAHSAARTILPSPGLVAHIISLSTKVEDFLQVGTPPTLHYTNFSSSISHRPSLSNALPSDREIFSHIVHPYHTAAFNSFLTKHKLYKTYPLLVNNLCYGFPLGGDAVFAKHRYFPEQPLFSILHEQN